MAKTVEMKITNIWANGDYTGQLLVGDPPVPVDLLLDTGSSTLGIKPGHYDPDKDSAKQVTDAVQQVEYGTGGWEGPVFETRVAFAGEQASGLALKTFVALAYPSGGRTNNFSDAGGILGLAYKPMNDAFLFTDEQGKPISTWPFNQSTLPKKASAQVFIAPYFTQLEENGVVANKFAFYTLRSMRRFTAETKTYEDLAKDPLNQGLFIWGGGEDRTDLHTGEFESIAVVHDQYYNTHLISMQVGDAAAQPVDPPEKRAFSNSIIDSGTNTLALTPKLYAAVLAGFSADQRAFLEAHKPARPNQLLIVPTSELDLSSWPTLSFTFWGAGAEHPPVTLRVPPETYWQTDMSFQNGQSLSSFAIGEGGEQGQSILGLPLMNNYFTIFDRSAPGFGEIAVAPIKRPS